MRRLDRAGNPCPAEVPELECYSPLVRRKETDRIMGAATTTTGSIAAHEMIQDNSQWIRNWPIVTNGKLAIPAAITHVNPAWITAKIKWLNRRGMPNIVERFRVTRAITVPGTAVRLLFEVRGLQSSI